MADTDKFLKTDNLNEMIIKIIPYESTGVLVDLIILSALATVYLRNNDLTKYKSVEAQIDEALKRFEEYKVDFIKSA